MTLKKTKNYVLLLVLFTAVKLNVCNATDVSVINTKCESLINPLGIDVPNPALSWNLNSSKRGCMQYAYKIIVSSSKEKLKAGNGDVWNSGKIISGNSIFVKYNGKSLVSNHNYFWKVVVWTNNGKDSAQSEPAYWTTGLMNPADWKAKWIGLDSSFAWDSISAFHSKLSARYFRKELILNKPIKKATAYLAGLGLYEFYLNGTRIGNQVLSPTASDYSKRVYVNTFDVTNALATNKNTIGIILGNGRFFSMRQGKAGEWKQGIPTITNFGYPKLLFQLEVEYQDGSSQTIISDNTWKVTANGPIRSNNEYDGETYDANKEITGWNTNSFNEEKWLPVTMTAAPGGKICAQPNPNMEIMQVLKPVSVTKNDLGNYIINMGQNMVGRVSVQMKGAKGKEVKLRFAERLDDSGRLYTANLRDAEVTDRYILKGSEAGEKWEPSFVYHGFQYIEISGLETLTASDIDGKVIYDKMETTGTFMSSNKTLNQVFKNAWWTISGNYKGMPVDCPQRDERMGWLGDRSINSVGESFLLNNAHVYSKWMDDIKDAQLENGSIPDIAPAYWRLYSDNMTWPSTYLFGADMLYRQYGNSGIIKAHYPYMKKWLSYMEKYLTKDLIMTKDNYGDWCMPPESKELIFSKDSTRITPGDFIASSYYYKCLAMMAKFASISGIKNDEKEYLATAEKVKNAINAKFYNNTEFYYANNTTTANLLALSFGIAPAEANDAIAKNIITVISKKFNNHLSTGLIGNQWLMRGLSQQGYSDIAFKIATNTSYPSWGYMIGNGATTIWELWNGNTANPAMNSGNHVMLLGDLLIWYYENLAGIKSIEAGFKKIEMKPYFPQELNYVNASHISPYGKIESNWSKNGNEISWEIAIPENSSALIYLPTTQKNKIKIDGKPAVNTSGIRFLNNTSQYSIVELGSGKYRFAFPL